MNHFLCCLHGILAVVQAEKLAWFVVHQTQRADARDWREQYRNTNEQPHEWRAHNKRVVAKTRVIACIVNDNWQRPAHIMQQDALAASWMFYIFGINLVVACDDHSCGSLQRQAATWKVIMVDDPPKNCFDCHCLEALHQERQP